MKQAFVMITSKLGTDDEVLEALRKIPKVKETHQIYGVYDVIVRVEARALALH